MLNYSRNPAKNKKIALKSKLLCENRLLNKDRGIYKMSYSIKSVKIMSIFTEIFKSISYFT